MCGTGTETDTDASLRLNQTVPLGKLGDEFPVTGIGYTITFNDGNGALRFDTGGINSAGHSFDTLKSKGLIQTVPAPTTLPGPNECSDLFEVAGNLHLEY
jgi:hypothetical protein